MTFTVWTVTSDTDCGLQTTAHTTEQEACEELRRRFVRTASEDSHFEQMMAARLYPQLMSWVSHETDRRGCDSHRVESHLLESSVEAKTSALDAAYREAAIRQYGEEGRIEIDSNAIISYGDDDGAYVAAWVWVDRSEVPLVRGENDTEDEADALNQPAETLPDVSPATESIS